mgnify:CR=1 FL=1
MFITNEKIMLKEQLRQSIHAQENWLKGTEEGVGREILSDIPLKNLYISVISGIRRSGKSTLLRQLMNHYSNPVYFNFEDHRVYDFEVGDFEKLDQILAEQNPDAWFFDEIQNVKGWERYVRSAHDQGRKIFITGSNANLLSRELGTKLTGRYLQYLLFPFSYREFLTFKNLDPGSESLEKYMLTGGFPEYIKMNDTGILQQLFEDIIMRDVVVRYEIRQEEILKSLALFLISNTGKEFSYNKLSKRFQVGSVNTIINYVHYLANSFLLSPLSLYTYSLKKRAVNPKKIYAIDTGLIHANTLSFNDDLGRILENIVFIELCRHYKEIYYHRNDQECDFVVKKPSGFWSAIQVSYALERDNLNRELNGIREVDPSHLDEKLIITFDQEDWFGDIHAIPAWKWLSGVKT